MWNDDSMGEIQFPKQMHLELFETPSGTKRVRSELGNTAQCLWGICFWLGSQAPAGLSCGAYSYKKAIGLSNCIIHLFINHRFTHFL